MYRIVSYRIVSYYIVSYCIVSYYIVSYYIVSYCIVSYYIVSYLVVSYCIVSYCIVSYYIVLYCIVVYCIVFSCIVSYCIELNHIISCRIVDFLLFTRLKYTHFLKNRTLLLNCYIYQAMLNWTRYTVARFQKMKINSRLIFNSCLEIFKTIRWGDSAWACVSFIWIQKIHIL